MRKTPGHDLAAALVEVLDAGALLHDLADGVLGAASRADQRHFKGQLPPALARWNDASRAMLQLIYADLGPAAPQEQARAWEHLREAEVGDG